MEVEYPESDGEPMGETDLHRKWMIRIYDWLAQRYRDQRVYVASDLLVYYLEGSPQRYVVPDIFVVLDCEPRDRRVFKTWEEKKPPTVAFEVTSQSTQRNDLYRKPQVFAEIGVAEYFMFDPTSDYLLPPLRGFRLEGGRYVEIEPDRDGSLPSLELDICLLREAGRLVMYDRSTGERLQTEAEVERAARETAEAARKTAEAGRRTAEEARRLALEAQQSAEAARAAAEVRARAAEEELQRLRDQLGG